MGSRVTETFALAAVGVNASILRSSHQIGGFLAKTAGTITITDEEGTNLLDAVPVTAGWNPMPFYLTKPATRFTTAGGASGYFAL